MGKKGPQMAATYRSTGGSPTKWTDDLRKREFKGLDGVASIRGGLCPAVDFERLMDG